MATTAPPSPNSKASGKANISEPTAASMMMGASCQIRSLRAGLSFDLDLRGHVLLVGPVGTQPPRGLLRWRYVVLLRVARAGLHRHAPSQLGLHWWIDAR